MAAWVALQQSMRAVDSVERFWARELRLEPTDVLLFLLISRGEQTPTELGNRTGRSRQQVHRSLVRLEGAGFVTASLGRRGLVSGWRLTPAGLLRLECLERRMAIWEKQLSTLVDVDALIEQLRWMLRTLINRSVEGYFEGLFLPYEFRVDPNLEFVAEAAKLRASDAERKSQPSPTEARKEAGRELAAQAEKEDEEASRDAWINLWA